MNIYLNAIWNNGKTWNKRDYLLAAAKRLGYDWVLPYEKGVEAEVVLNIEPFKDFIKGSKWTGIWEIDLALNRQQMNGTNWAASDDIFVAVSCLPSRLDSFKTRTQLLFQACDPKIHKRIPEIKQEYDFVFSGTNGDIFHEERARLIKLLRKSFSFCDGGKDHAPWEYIKFLNQAKIQFIRSGNTPITNGWTAQRFFECLAIGPVLTEWTEDLARTGLIEGEDYMSYKNDKELIQKMHKLLDDKNYANYIAENGRKKALLYHSYDHRLISIINSIRSHKVEI